MSGRTTAGQQEYWSSWPIFQTESSATTRISTKPTNANRASASGRDSPVGRAQVKSWEQQGRGNHQEPLPQSFVGMHSGRAAGDSTMRLVCPPMATVVTILLESHEECVIFFPESHNYHSSLGKGRGECKALPMVACTWHYCQRKAGCQAAGRMRRRSCSRTA